MIGVHKYMFIYIVIKFQTYFSLCFVCGLIKYFLIIVNWGFILDVETVCVGLDIVAGAGYQYDYIFDWTILKYPQIGANYKGRVGSCKF